MTRVKNILKTISLLLLFSVATNTFAQEYKKFKREKSETKSFSIEYRDNQYHFNFFLGDSTNPTNVVTSQYLVEKNKIIFDNKVIFTNDSVTYQDISYPVQLLSDMKIEKLSDNDFKIIFYSDKKLKNKSKQKYKGNIFSLSDSIVVGSASFARGFIFSVTGNISVHGEVNRDIVSLFGTIRLSETAVARGDIATFDSKIEIDSDAAVYGEIFSGLNQKSIGIHRLTLNKNFSVGFNFKYNRVDGANPNLTFKFKHSESSLPEVSLNGGYAFESERARYDFSIKQELLGSEKLSLGGSIYRQLRSSDDWLLSDNENIVFTLFATEDFKDYYEAEGWSVILESKLAKRLNAKLEYNSYDVNYFPAQPHLWSMFGGNKLFGQNFPNAILSKLNSFDIDEFALEFDYDSRIDSDKNHESYFHLNTQLEHYSSNFSPSGSYYRYFFRASSQQKIDNKRKLYIHGAAGTRSEIGSSSYFIPPDSGSQNSIPSNGFYPIYNQFYLGGLGTLRGYDHKEFTGNAFYLLNIEFIQELKPKSFAISVFYDIGKISNIPERINTELKDNIGLGLYLTNNFRIYFAKRLDDDPDKKIKTYVRFSSKF